MASVDWPGLFKWSMQYQDGTLPSSAEGAKALSGDDSKWCVAASCVCVRHRLGASRGRAAGRAQHGAAPGVAPARCRPPALRPLPRTRASIAAAAPRRARRECATFPNPSGASLFFARLTEALEHFSLDGVKRMQEVKRLLDDQGGKGGAAGPPPPSTAAAASASSSSPADLLDELVDAVASIDAARDWVLVGGGGTLLRLVSNPESDPAVAAGAAHAIGVAAACNEPVQDWFVGEGAVGTLLAAVDRGATADARAKAWLALGALARHCDRGAAAFMSDGGPAALVAAAGEDAAAPARKALHLAAAMARERPAAGVALVDAGLLAPLCAALQGGGDGATAAADALAALAASPAAHAVAADARVAPALAAAAARHGGLVGDDADAAADEAAACAAATTALDAAAAAPAPAPGMAGADVLRLTDGR